MQKSSETSHTSGSGIAAHFALVDSDGEGVVHASSSHLWHGNGVRMGCTGFFPKKLNQSCPRISRPPSGPCSEHVFSSSGVIYSCKIASSCPPFSIYGSSVMVAKANVQGTSPASATSILVAQGPSFKEAITAKRRCRSFAWDA
ncbi:hypothetical protein SUGI_0773320 [Cryptomeria japonica]|nr:hypothetical protein SUGI_0773320 [Cryptomeria japonica]